MSYILKVVFIFCIILNIGFFIKQNLFFWKSAMLKGFSTKI